MIPRNGTKKHATSAAIARPDVCAYGEIVLTGLVCEKTNCCSLDLSSFAFCPHPEQNKPSIFVPQFLQNKISLATATLAL